MSEDLMGEEEQEVFMGTKSWKAYLGIMKVYFVLVTVASVLAVIGTVVLKRPWWMLLGLLSNFAQIVALYGFCFTKKIFRRSFWQFAFFLFVLDELSGDLIMGFSKPFSHYVLYFLFLVGPIFLAMGLYAFKRDDLWGEGISSK